MFPRLNKYHQQFNTIDAFKCLAVLAMIIDHIGIYLLDDDPTFRVIGRIAAPLFFFLVGFNISHYQAITSLKWQNWVKPPLNLISFGIILTFTYYLIYHGLNLNILLNIFLIKQCLHYYSPKNQPDITVLLLVLALLILNVYCTNWLEYGLLGLAYARGGQLLFDGRRKLAVLIFLLTVLAQFYDYWEYQPQFNHPLLIVAGFIIWSMLSTFKYKELQVPLRLKKILLFFSRYCFEIYFFHLFLLQACYLIFLGTYGS